MMKHLFEAAGWVTALLLLWATLLILFTRPCPAAEIVGPDEPVEAKTPVWIEIVDTEVGTAVAFEPSELLDTNPKHVALDAALFWTDKPGTYIVKAIAINWEARTFSFLSCRVVVDDPNPPEPPGPKPGEKHQLMIFHESADLDSLPTGQRLILTSASVHAEIAKTGNVFLGIADIDDSGVDGRGKYQVWWDAVAGHKLPCIAMAALDGGDISVIDLPATPEDFRELLGDMYHEAIR